MSGTGIVRAYLAMNPETRKSDYELARLVYHTVGYRYDVTKAEVDAAIDTLEKLHPTFRSIIRLRSDITSSHPEWTDPETERKRKKNEPKYRARYSNGKEPAPPYEIPAEIIAQNREIELTRVIMILLTLQMPGSAIKAAVDAVNNERCRPQLDPHALCLLLHGRGGE